MRLSPVSTGLNLQAQQKKAPSAQTTHFQGAYQRLLAQDQQTDLGHYYATHDQFHDDVDANLNGMIESSTLKNGISYWFTKAHKALFLTEAVKVLESQGKPFTWKNVSAAKVKDAVVEWIASLSEDEAIQVYGDTDQAIENRKQNR